MTDITISTPSLKEQLMASLVHEAKKNGKLAFAGKEKRKTSATKLPVPPPRPDQQAASAARTIGEALAETAEGRDALAKIAEVSQIARSPEQSAIQAEISDKRAELTSLPPDVDEVPDFLKVENRTPLTPEQQATVDANLEKARADMTAAKDAAIRAKQKEAKRERDKARRAAKKEAQAAIDAGKATAMPLTGKDALKAIAAAGKPAPAKAPQKPKAPPKAKAPQKPKGAPKAKAPQKAKAPAKKPTTSRANGKTKTAIVGELLRRKSGCTMAEVLAATGWPTCTIPGKAKALGLKLRIEKRQGEVKRYFGS